MFQSVTSPNSPEALRFCQAHELPVSGRGAGCPSVSLELIINAGKSIREGFGYIAPVATNPGPQPSGMGRNAGTLKKISKIAGVNLITLTGCNLLMF